MHQKKGAALFAGFLFVLCRPFICRQVYSKYTAHHGDEDIANIIDELPCIKEAVIAQVLKQEHDKRIDQAGQSSDQPSLLLPFSSG